MQGGFKQDVSAFALILGTAFMHLKQYIPKVSELFLLSENVGCCQNSTLSIMLLFVPRKSELTAVKFLHPETQDGNL